MHPVKRAIFTAGMAIMLVLPTATAIAADDPVPPGMTPVAEVEPVPPSDCDVEPANLDRLQEVAGSAVNDPSRVFDEKAPPIATGDVVTGDEADAVIEAADTFIACMNANDEVRAVTLLSDSLITRAAYDIVGSLNDSPGGTPEPIQEHDWLAITKTTDVTQTGDGRLAYSVGVGYTFPDDPNEYVTTRYVQFIAVEQRGEWKIDDLRYYPVSDEPTDCGSADADGCTQVTATGIRGDGYSGNIMPAELSSGTAGYFLSTGDTDLPAFTPADAMVAEAEAALPAYVAASPRATERIVDNLKTFQRQYLGFETPDGPVLAINAFCDSVYDPASSVVIVMDGGDCYWQAIYDLTTHAFTHFSVNGNA